MKFELGLKLVCSCVLFLPSTRWKKVVDFGKPLLQSLWGNLLQRCKSCSRKLWMGQAVEERLCRGTTKKRKITLGCPRRKTAAPAPRGTATNVRRPTHPPPARLYESPFVRDVMSQPISIFVYFSFFRFCRVVSNVVSVLFFLFFALLALATTFFPAGGTQK